MQNLHTPTWTGNSSPTPVVAFLSLAPKVAALAFITRIFNILFAFCLDQWHFILEILAISSMILGDCAYLFGKSSNNKAIFGSFWLRLLQQLEHSCIFLYSKFHHMQVIMREHLCERMSRMLLS
jgi:hypothetical protein